MKPLFKQNIFFLLGPRELTLGPDLAAGVIVDGEC